MPQPKPRTSGVRWISRREVDALVDARARSVLGVSGEEFVANWKAGKYSKMDSDDCPGVIELALMAPLPRQTSAGKKRKGSR